MRKINGDDDDDDDKDDDVDDHVDYDVFSSSQRILNVIGSRGMRGGQQL